jgi:hypothetical protein
MNKHLIVIGTAVLLLVVGLSGCIETEDNEPSNSIVGLWKRESDSLHYQYYINGTRQIFTEYNNYSGGAYYQYTYKNNVLTKKLDSVSSEFWDIEWLDSDTFTETSRDTGSSYVFNRVVSLPT